MVAPGWAKRVPRRRSARRPGCAAGSTCRRRCGRPGTAARPARSRDRRRRGRSGRPGGSGCRRAPGGADRPWRRGGCLAEAVHIGKHNDGGMVAACCRSWGTRGGSIAPSAPARRLERRACARRSADLARRRMRTTIHWARDDAFWWAVEPRTTRARTRWCSAMRPTRRPGARASPARSTCRAPAPTGRSRASSPPTNRGALPRPFRPHGHHRGQPAQGGLPRIPARRRVAARGLARRRGDRGAGRGAARQPAAHPPARAFVDAVRGFKAGDRRARGPASASAGARRRRRRPATAGWSTSPCTRSSASAACSAATTISSRCAASARSRCSRWSPTAGPRSSPRRRLAVARRGARRGRLRPILIAPAR